MGSSRVSQSAGGGDEAIHHHNPTGQRASEHHAGQHPYLEPTYLGEHVQTVVWIGLVHLQGALYNRNLVRHLAVVSPCPLPGRLTWRSASQGCGYGARRRGVAYTHVAGAYDVSPTLSGLQRNVDSSHHAHLGLHPCHGRTLGNVGCAAPHADYSQVRVGRQRRGYTGIDDHEVHARLPRHGVDSRTARKEVQHHLGRDFLRIASDSLRDHAVVGSGHNNRLAPRLWPLGPEYPGQLHRQLFQAAQAARRLGQTTLPKLGCPPRLGIGRANAPYHVVESHL